MKKSILVLASLLVIASMLLSACATSTASAKPVNNNAVPEKGQPINWVKAATPVVPAAATPTPTPIPTAMTVFDEQFAMLDKVIEIPVGARDATVKYLSPLNGKMYFIQKYYFSSGGVGFAFYRSEKIWVKAPVGTLNAQSTPVASMEVVVPVGGDIGMSQFFWEAVPTKWAIASDFSTSIVLENNPWYK